MNRQTTFCLLLLLVVGTISANWMAPVIQAAPPAQAPTPTIDAGLKAQADKLKEEGNALAQNNELEASLDKYNQALELYRRIADTEGEARALYNIGLVYFYLESYEEALNYLEQALPLSPNVKEPPLEIYILTHMGFVYQELGDYHKALEQLEQALLLLQAVGDPALEVAILSQIGTLYQSLGDYQRAIDYHKQALSLWREPEDRLNIASSLELIALMYTMLGNQKEGLDYYRQALPLWQALNEPVREANTLKNMGLNASALGDAQQALIFYEQARTIWQNQHDEANEADILEIMGQLYLTLGDYQKALDYYYNNALQLWQRLEEQGREATALTNIGFTYNLLDEQEEALNSYKQALEIWEELGNYREEKARTHADMAFIYKWSGDEELALKEYQKALSLWQELDDQFHQSNTLGQLALTNVLLGQQAKARDDLQQAIQLSEAVEEEQAKALLLSRIALVYESLGEYESAHRYRHQALVFYQETGQGMEEALTLFYIGQNYDIQGELEQALDFYLQAVKVSESIRASATLEELKTALAEQSVDLYQQTILLLIRLGQPAQAFDMAERARARTFLDQMGNVRIDPKATDDPELLTREQELLGEIRALEKRLSGDKSFISLDSTTQSSPPPLTGEEHNSAKERLEAAYGEHEQLLLQIKLTNPQYASLRSVQTSTLITVQQTLPPEITLLEYYVAPTQTLAFVVTPDDFHTIPISITAPALKEAIGSLRSNLLPQGKDVPPLSKELYDLLVAPIRQHIKTDGLIIAPHNVLHYLPFGALHDGERYLVEDYAISYLPSASVLEYILSQVPNETSGTLLALANPSADKGAYLEHVIAESEAIAALAGSRAITGTEATETRFLIQAPQAYRIHLAAHGELKESAPQSSRLYLSPDETNDGYLEVHELFNLNLPQTDLVTLSACETQLGKQSAGDELVGLSRAFIYAGTPSLVATLWSVNDESTRFLMEHFYGYLQEGTGKASALRQAQLDTMAQYPSPYHWAAFTLIGDMGEVEVVTNDPDWRWLWLGGAVLIFVVAAAWWLSTRSTR